MFESPAGDEEFELPAGDERLMMAGRCRAFTAFIASEKSSATTESRMLAVMLVHRLANTSEKRYEAARNSFTPAGAK